MPNLTSDKRGYKVYTALLTQSGTDAPVATVLENTLGIDVIWIRLTVGNYKTVSVKGMIGFNANKLMLLSSNISDLMEAYGGCISVYMNTSIDEENDIGICTINVSDNLSVDGGLYRTPVEIRVYN